MGMSSHVKGFIPTDEDWKKMSLAYTACKAAGVNPPEEVNRFFDYEDPDPEGVSINLEGRDCCKEYRDDMCKGFDIHIDKLPVGVKVVRFYNSY